MPDHPKVPVDGPGPGAGDDAELDRGTTSRRMDSIGEGKGERPYPRTPAERDESSDSQDGGVREVIRQGHDDLRDGLQDTSYKPATEKAYEMQKGAGAAGTPAAAPDRSGAGVHKTDAGRGPGETRTATSDVRGQGASPSTIAADEDARRTQQQRDKQ